MRKTRKKQNNDINYLDLIPERNEALGWHRDLKERVILEVENTGIKYFQIVESYRFVKFVNKPEK